MRQRSLAPTKKVAVGGITGMVASVLVYAVFRVWRVDLPLDVATALAGIVVAAVAWVAAYLTAPAAGDAPVPAARRRRDPISHERA